MTPADAVIKLELVSALPHRRHALHPLVMIGCSCGCHRYDVEETWEEARAKNNTAAHMALRMSTSGPFTTGRSERKPRKLTWRMQRELDWLAKNELDKMVYPMLRRAAMALEKRGFARSEVSRWSGGVRYAITQEGLNYQQRGRP